MPRWLLTFLMLCTDFAACCPLGWYSNVNLECSYDSAVHPLPHVAWYNIFLFRLIGINALLFLVKSEQTWYLHFEQIFLMDMEIFMQNSKYIAFWCLLECHLTDTNSLFNLPNRFRAPFCFLEQFADSTTGAFGAIFVHVTLFKK